MSKVSNCIHMLGILMARGKVKVEVLARELEVKERMVREYKVELEKAGIYIESERGPYGGYYLNEDTLLPIRNFSSSELQALNIALRSVLSKGGSHNHRQDLQLALDKINAMQRKDAYNSRHLYFANNYMVNNEIGDESGNFKKLYKALLNRQKVNIVYSAASTTKTTTRVIHPYAFVVYDDFFYCTAYCQEKHALRNFKLMRIKTFQLLDDTYRIPEEFHIRKAIPELGFVNDPIDVELTICPPYSYIVKESIYSRNQRITPLDNGKICFKAEMNGKKSIKKWILGMGVHAEVIKPHWLKQEIIHDLEEIIQQY